MCTLIEEENVNIVALSIELEKAVIQHDLQENETIYVTEDGFFPFWIGILNKRGFVGFSTHTFFKKSSTQFQRLEFCDKINSTYFMLTAYTTDDNKIKVDHVISYRDGILRETFLRACRQFSRTIETALQELDPENAVAMLPGQTESEDTDAKNE